ncbi:MAG: helix-turn-helix domain-containing protein [Parvibaculum sp.]|uniref:TetR/AcrR family transcriptional regulator n=1 Tax=Parvibaculum sp. TaxID=2024848 RepID=UPI0034A05136
MSEVEAPESRKRLSQQKRRDAVLAAADKLFHKAGYEAARIEDIAEESGVSLGTIYNYFGSKGGIMEALIAPMTQRMEARGAAILARPPARLMDAVGALYEAYRFEDDWKSLQMLQAFDMAISTRDTHLAHVHEDYERFITAQFRRLLEAFAAAGKLRPELDIEDAAFLLYRLMLMHFLAYVQGRGRMTYEAMQVDMHRRMRAMVTGWSP